MNSTATASTTLRRLSDEQLATVLADLERRFDALDDACWPAVNMVRDELLTEILAARLEIARRRA